VSERYNWTASDIAAHHQERGGTIPALPKAKGRIKPLGYANKTEAAYGAHLAAEQRAGAVLWWRYGSVTLRLADDTRFTPDFCVMLADSCELQFHEVKGFFREDAKIKIKVAAEMYPLTFLAVFKEPNGGWRYEDFS
jgi:hypothetical protein